METEEPPTNFIKTNPKEHFEVLERLGEGAYGVVEKVRSKETGEVLAAKITPKGKHTASTVNEIMILEQLKDKNILKMQAKYETEKEFWIILEFCTYGSLYDFLKKIKFSLDDALISVISFDMLNALNYLHKKGIIHRDIKARNILLDFEGVCKISDFGISKANSKGKTFIGSPLWMAPEQVSTENYTSKIDVWSLGITLLEVAEGKVPHKEKNPYAAMVAITQSSPPTLSKPERFSGEFQHFISRCLVKDPAKRASVEELLDHYFIKMYLKTHDVLRMRLTSSVQRASSRASMNSQISTLRNRVTSEPTLESMDAQSMSMANQRKPQNRIPTLGTLQEDPVAEMSLSSLENKSDKEITGGNQTILALEGSKKEPSSPDIGRNAAFTLSSRVSKGGEAEQRNFEVVVDWMFKKFEGGCKDVEEFKSFEKDLFEEFSNITKAFGNALKV